MAPVNQAHWESTLPLTLSLSDSGNYFYPLALRRRAPNTNFFLPLFLFRANAAPATHGRAAELGGRWQRHPA